MIKSVTPNEPSGEHGARSSGSSDSANSARPMRHVHVHLDWGRDRATWTARYERGEVWDEDPYGYSYLDSRFNLTHSVDKRSGPALGFMKRGLRKMLGADLPHAWHNRADLRSADYVITHSEIEFLAALLVLRVLRDRRKKVVCQAVWLWDRWPALSSLKRRVYRHLMTDCLVLTTLSPSNLAVAKKELPNLPAAFVPFGIRPLDRVKKDQSRADRSVRILAVGNDRHRDWPTLSRTLASLELRELRVLTSSKGAQRAFSRSDAVVRSASGPQDYRQELSWCDVVVVPLLENMHASGVTVILEALSAGVPVVAGDTGGLQAYFDEGVYFYEVRNPQSLAKAIGAAATPAARADAQQAANEYLPRRGLRSIDYAARHGVLLAAHERMDEKMLAAVSEFAPLGDEWR